MGYAKEYLAYMRKYTGGDYREVFASVTGDIRSLGDAASAALPAAEQQLAVIKMMAEEARIAAGMQLTETQRTNELLQALFDRIGTLAGVSPEVLEQMTVPPAPSGIAIPPPLPAPVVQPYQPSSGINRVITQEEEQSQRRRRGMSEFFGSDRPININLTLDGKVISNTIVRSLRSGDTELVSSLKRTVA
jgi:hypothetical protein